MRNRIDISIFYLSILIMGISPVFFHVLLLRELISNFFGNELIIAIFLALWLIIEALGSGLLAKPIVKRTDPVSLYSALLLFNAILGPVSLFLSRIIRNLFFLEFGELPNLFLITSGILVVITPLAAADGCMFTAGYHMGRSIEKKRSKIVGHVYAVESFGSVLGGISVTGLIFLNLSPFEMVLILSAANVLLSVFLNFIFGSGYEKSKMFSFISSTAGILILFLLFLNLSWLETISTSLRWKEYDIFEFKNSLYHQIVLTGKDQQKSLFVDGKAVASLPQDDIVSNEEFSHIPLLYKKNVKRILLIGKGPGGLIYEFLKYPDITIDYLQPDKEIIQTFHNTHSFKVETELLNPRVNTVIGDPVTFVQRKTGSYDVVFIAAGSPSTFLESRYFTIEFLKNLKKVLSSDGILAIKTIGGESYIIEELKGMLATLYTTLTKSFRFTHVVPGENLILMASDRTDFSRTSLSDTISELKGADLQTEYLSPYVLQVKFHPAKVALFSKIFSDGQNESNSVNKPLIVNQALAYESSIYDPFWGRFLSTLSKIPPSLYFVVCLFPLLFFFLFSKYTTGTRRYIMPLTIGLTGLVGMVGSMAITIFFQQLFGSLYLKMGLIFASFMMGLFISAITVSQGLTNTHLSPKFILVIECFICFLFLALIPIFSSFTAIYGSKPLITVLEVSLYFLNLLIGCLVGIEFPVANFIMENEGKEAGGILYAFDLIGAFAGAIIFVTLMLPFVGFLFVFLLVASLKLMNILIIVYGFRI